MITVVLPTKFSHLSRQELGLARRDLVKRRDALYAKVVDGVCARDPLGVLAGLGRRETSGFFMAMLLASKIGNTEAFRECDLLEASASLARYSNVCDELRLLDLAMLGDRATGMAVYKCLAPTVVIPRTIDDLFEVFAVRLGYGGHFVRFPDQLVLHVPATERAFESVLGVTSVVAIRIVEAARAHMLYEKRDATSAREAMTVEVGRVVELANESLSALHGPNVSVVREEVMAVLMALGEEISAQSVVPTADELSNPFALAEQGQKPIRFELGTGRLYCLSPHLLPYALESFAAGLVKEFTDHPTGSEIVRERGESLEDAVESVLRRSLGRSASIWSGVSYFEKATGRKLGEIDVVASIGNFTALVECKSGAFSVGHEGAVSSAIKELARHPSDQLARFHETLKTLGPSGITLTDADKLPLSRRSARAFFAAFDVSVTVPLVVTLDDLGVLPTLPINIAQSRNTTESPNIPALSIGYSDFAQLGSVLAGGHFATYLTQRIHWINSGEYFAEDEMGLLSVYLTRRLGQQPSTPTAVRQFGQEWRDNFDVEGRTVPGVSVYEWRRLRSVGMEVPVPQVDVPGGLASLLSILDEHRPKNWTIAFAALLAFDDEFEGKLDGLLRDLNRALECGEPPNPMRILLCEELLLILDASPREVARTRTTPVKRRRALQISGASALVAINYRPLRKECRVECEGTPTSFLAQDSWKSTPRRPNDEAVMDQLGELLY